MAESKRAKAGKKNRKHGRNLKECQRYRAENRFEKNKALRMARHIRRMAKKAAKRAGASAPADALKRAA